MVFQVAQVCLFASKFLFPTFGVELLDFKLNSSPRPELFSSRGTLRLARSTPRDALECPTPETPWSANPWSAQPKRLLERPESPWSAQPRLPGVPNPGVPNPGVPNLRVSLECPTPESPWSAQPQLQAKTKKAYLNQCVFV